MCPGESLLDTVLCQSPCCMQANVIHVSFVHAFIAALLKHGQVRQTQLNVVHECGLYLVFFFDLMNIDNTRVNCHPQCPFLCEGLSPQCCWVPPERD